MSLSLAAGPRPIQPDYHLWCEEAEFSTVIICQKCGLKIDTTTTAGTAPMYGCPGNLHERL